MSVTPRTDAADWKTKPLGEVCSLISRGVSPKYLADGGIRVLNQRCIRDHEIEWSICRRHDDKEKRVALDRFLQFGDGLINSTGTGTLGRVAQVIGVIGEPTTVDSHVTIVRSKPGMFHPEFFGYMLVDIEDQLKNSGEGCGGQTELARNTIADKMMVCFPSSITEQKHIATTLREAFDGIADAEERIKSNLLNARVLFEARLELRFRSGGEGWETKALSDLCDFKHGFAFRSEYFAPEGHHVLLTPGNFYERGGYRDRGEKQKYYQGDFPREFLLNPGDLLVAMTEQAAGLLGSPLIVPESGSFLHNQRLGLVKSRPGVPWLNSFFFYVFNTKTFRKAVHDSASGVKVRHTSPTKLGEVSVSFPISLAEQQTMVNEMEEIYSDTVRLEALYSKKLLILRELKKALLHRAFSGQLLKQHSQAIIIPFPITLQNVSSTDLHVGVLAVAYASHEALHKASDFGHVKAEKIAHMVEAYVGVDLGRTPVRDAAGPNDFPHLKKVEHRADKAGYLTFARQSSGAYRVTKKAGFDSLVTKTRAALGHRNQDLEKLLDLMTPMTTKQAEIFATVYAAWNNLLIDGEPITDERIVHAAREDWHSDKLSIPRDKFFTAIEWIRTKGICPEGKGKRVERKGPNH
jgi:type I restriction enzyme S subunit